MKRRALPTSAKRSPRANYDDAWANRSCHAINPRPGSSKEIGVMSLSRTFSDFAESVAHATGRPWTFVVCVAIVILWAVSGPLFDFSETWQLVINTGTTIVTFLMV